MYQPDRVAEFVHKIVSIYVQQVAFGCMARNQLITYFLVYYSFRSLCFSSTWSSVSSPRILELRTFMIPIFLKGLQRYKVGTE